MPVPLLRGRRARRHAAADSMSATRVVVTELVHPGAGLYDRGHRHYAWYVDLAPHTLIGMTHADSDPTTYTERQRVLDRMMNRLELP